MAGEHTSGEAEALRRRVAELERQLAESERSGNDELLEFFGSSSSLVCTAGFDGHFKLMSPAWPEVLGFTVEQLCAEPFLSFVHPDDRESTIAAAQGLTVGHEAVAFKNRYRTADGGYRWLEWNAFSSLPRQLFYCFARDITDAANAEAERRRAEERLRHVLHASRVVLYSARLDADFTLTFISDNVLEQLGYTAREVLSTPRFWLDHLLPDDLPRFLSGLKNVSLKDRYEHDYRFLHKNGDHRWVHDEIRVQRDERGAAVEITGSCQDITERKQAESMIRAQAAALTELSTPLIPISDKVIAMPLIGTMDTRRAQQVLDTLLDGIASRGAEAAILDVTGVAIVDTQVANALLRAAKAAQLLGAEVVLTGIRSEVAQTLVTIGADLGAVVTRGTLKAGIEYATRKR